MKKMQKLLAGVLTGMLIAAPVGLLRAQDDTSQGTEEAGQQQSDHAKMKKDLGLTADQSTKLKAVEASEKTAMKPLQDKEKDLIKALRDQVKNKATDDQITATLADLQANRKAMMDQGEQFRAQKDAILTPTQQAKMVLKMHHLRKEVKHEMHEKMQEKTQSGN